MKSKFLLLICALIPITLLSQSNLEKKLPKYKNKLPVKVNESLKKKEKIFPRKLQDDNYVIINFDTTFSTDTCWYSHIVDKISKVEIDDQQVSDFQTSFSIQEGSTVKIYFNTQLNDLSSFLSPNADAVGGVSSECESEYTFISHIVSIDFSNFDASQVTTGAKMFNQYTSLTTINFGNLATSNFQNMNSMFQGCSSLEEVDLSNLNTALVTDMNSMFFNCEKLSSVNFGSIDTSKVENMNYMFANCYALEQIDISNFDTSSVTDMSSMFSSAGLISFSFPHTENPELLTMEMMFSDCSKLREIDFSGFDTSKVTNMKRIFFECTSLKSIDLSVLDTSSLITVEDFCSGCISLETFITSGINTGHLTSIDAMLYNCHSLKSIDFSKFASSTIESMNYVFYNCTSLKYIDFSNIEYPSSTSYNYLFFDCSSLIALEIPKLFMKYLLRSEEPVFSNNNKLRYINLENIKYDDSEDYDEGTCGNNQCDLPLNYNDKPLIVCQTNKFITNTNIYEICCKFNVETEMCESDNYIVLYFNHDCTYENGFKKGFRNDINFINYNNETIIDTVALNILAGTKLEIHFKSTITNMENFFSREEDDNMIYVISIDLSHFKSSSVVNMANIFKGCQSLSSIDLSNIDTSNVENMNYMFAQCTSLKEINLSNAYTTAVTTMDYMFYNCSSLSVLDISNFNLMQVTSAAQMFSLIKNLDYINLYNTQDNGILSSSEINTDSEKEFYVCQKTNIITISKALNCCNYYNNEAHCDEEIVTTIPYYPAKTTINAPTNSNEAETNKISNTITVPIINITEQIQNLYNSIIKDLKNENYKIIQTQNAIIQYSTVEEQLNNRSNLVSSIDLGDCEQKLREQEGLNESEQFLMVKLDIRNLTLNATYVQYEIFNPHNYSKVSLDICKNISIKIEVPVALEISTLSFITSLEDSGYNIFDITDDFYNDICSTYTAPNGADMTLSSRKTRIYDSVKDLYLCQEGCEFESFDSNTSKAQCSCQVQETESVTDVSKISFKKSEFIDSFYSTLYNSNFRVLNCFKLIFSLKGFKGNYGCYTMTFLFGSFIAFIFVHLIKGQTKIIDVLRDILKSRGIIKNKNHSKEKAEKEKQEKAKEEERKIDKRKVKRNYTTKHKSARYHGKKPENLEAPTKRKDKKRSKTMKFDKLMTTENEIIDKKDETNKIKMDDKIKNIKEEKIKEDDIQIKDEKAILEKYKALTEVEVNTLDYEIAVIVDKRTFCQYYLCLLKREHLIIFTFITTDDFNLRQIKILLFIVSFSLYFTINAFFFYDETMDKIYEDNGIFDFIFQLPQIIYSSVISSVINIILQKLSITEDQILDMKKEKNIEALKRKARKIKGCLKIKLTIFLALSSALMLFFWYFISCFCAAYKNTQLILIEDTLISFFTSMLYPFGLKLLPGIFRIQALRAPKKDMKYIYKISRILNIL